MGCAPHDSHGPFCFWGCGFHRGVEEDAEEEETIDVCGGLEVVALCNFLVDGWKHDGCVVDEDVESGFFAEECRDGGFDGCQVCEAEV